MVKTENTVLIVEDGPDDRELLQDAIQQVNPEIKVKFAENGLDALNYLEAVQQDKENLPCLIVLDLNMPYVDGKETFRRLQQHDLLCTLPVVVFTSSQNPNDQELFQSQGVSFITKPDHFSVLHDMAEQMLQLCSRQAVNK